MAKASRPTRLVTTTFRDRSVGRKVTHIRTRPGGMPTAYLRHGNKRTSLGVILRRRPTTEELDAVFSGETDGT